MTTVARPPRTIYTNPSRAARPRPEASGRERFWWYFMRLSGLALVILALGLTAWPVTARLVRAEYLVDTQSLTKIQGVPFRASEIEHKIREMMA